MTVVNAVEGLALVEGVLVRAARACVLWWGRGDGVNAASRRGGAIAATVASSRTPRQTTLARDGRPPPQARLGPPLGNHGLADLLEVVENG